MNTSKVMHRIARLAERPELLDQVARDIGFALARGEREQLRRVATEIAARAPAPASGSAPGDEPEAGVDELYWAGFAAGLGTLLAAFEAAFEREDARAAALRTVTSANARAVVRQLATSPSTGAMLAERLKLTPSAVSKILTGLREHGIARVLGGGPYPKRGAKKPHVLTPLGSWLADEIAERETAAEIYAAHALARGA